MQFRIATTFTASLAKLSSGEQTAVKTTVFDLQTDPARPGFRMHRVEGARDRSLRSARVNQDIRIIVHQAGESLTLCYVDHHDNAYRWAQGRRMEAHPHTGAMQIVEIHETVREIEVPVYVEAERQAPPKPRPAAGMPDDQLLSYGVPVECWAVCLTRMKMDCLRSPVISLKKREKPCCKLRLEELRSLPFLSLLVPTRSTTQTP